MSENIPILVLGAGELGMAVLRSLAAAAALIPRPKTPTTQSKSTGWCSRRGEGSRGKLAIRSTPSAESRS